MNFKDQDEIQIHPIGMHDYKQCITNLNAVSNNNGVYAYFVDEKTASSFAQVVAVTTRRLELLMENIDINESDETSFNELELIYSEIKRLTQI